MLELAFLLLTALAPKTDGEPCKSSSECPPGLACMTVDPDCTEDSDCYGIVVEICMTPECWSDLDCKAGFSCEYHMCGAPSEESPPKKGTLINPF